MRWLKSPLRGGVEPKRKRNEGPLGPKGTLDLVRPAAWEGWRLEVGGGVVTMVTDGRPRPPIETVAERNSFHFGTASAQIPYLYG